MRKAGPNSDRDPSNQKRRRVQAESCGFCGTRSVEQPAEPQGRALMDRILFGDNQFFGVNHMSEEKARAQSLRFQKIEAIIDVLDAAYDEGIRVFMCTTHDRIGEVCDHVRAHPERYRDFVFYPCMPYAHKYAN